ncbi:MAG: YIP1 family protein [Anaerolineales bacterium]|nr:YIP1 family protein [Anaerolineales bacterium]
MMIEPADKVVQEKPVSPWFGMLYQPRKTIRYIVAQRSPTQGLRLLIVLLGFIQVIYGWFYLGFRREINLLLVFGLAVTAGPVAQAMANFFGGSYLSWVGSWFGGKATTDQARAALAWSKVPLVWGFSYMVPAFLVLGKDFLMGEYPYVISEIIGFGFSKLWLLVFTFTFFCVGLILIGFGLWSFVLSVLALAEAHQFSIWKALLTLTTGFGICLLPLICFLIFDNFVFDPRW